MIIDLIMQRDVKENIRAVALKKKSAICLHLSDQGK